MLKRYYQVFGSVLLVSDIVGLTGSWLLAYYLRFYTQLVPVTKGIPPFSRYSAMIIPVLFVWISVLAYFRLYGTQQIVRRTTELGATLRAHLWSWGIFLILTYIFSEYRFSRVVVGIFSVLAGLYLMSTRLALRNLLRSLNRDPARQKRTVIVGHGRTALGIVQRVSRMPELGLNFLGYFAPERGDVFSGLEYLGEVEELFAYCEKNKIEEIFVALPREYASVEPALLARLALLPVHVHVAPDVYDYIVVGCHVENFDSLPMISLNESPIHGSASALKRITDFVLSGLALIILSPIFILLALLIKLTSSGPVFYGQERMGIDGYTFKMWKFRSMRVNAEQETGAVWAKKDDARRTRIGSLLRSTSLDELPQFWNVFVGDMSLVGPRPERPQFVSQFRHNIPAYMLRHRVKAGITGWAQINGWRGDTSLEKRVECDLFYIRNWSFFFDIKILLLTVVRGFINKNAY